MCIGINTVSDVILSNMPGFIDGKSMKLSDLDLEFIATNVGGKVGKRNPDRMLVRHNFIELLCRLAVTRYLKVLKVARS